MPDEPNDNIVNFFNKNTLADAHPKTVVKIEISGCKIELELHGDTNCNHAKELIETCILSAVSKGKISAELFAKNPT